MGYNTVVAGTTISAAWGNQVRDQLITTMSSYAALTSAITTPAEGQYAYLTDTDTTWFYKNGAWRLVPGQVLFALKDTTSTITNVSGTNTVLTGTSFTVPGGGLASAQVYEVYFCAPCFNGAFTNGSCWTELQVAVNGGAYVSETQSGAWAINTNSGTWVPQKTHLYKTGATDTTTSFRVRMIAAGGNYDSSGSTTYPKMIRVTTTGYLSSEL